jgi:hypothetical protein
MRRFRRSTKLVTAAAHGARFQFTFTNAPGASFTALAATDVSLPLSNWTVLGGAADVSNGQFQFTDAHATDFPQRFYSVRSR